MLGNKIMVGRRRSKESRKKQSLSISGENHHNSKLTNGDIIRIKDFRYIDNFTQQEIADEFGVSRSCISHILNGHSWKDRVDKLAMGSL